MNERKRIYLIRHGQTEWNAQGRWQGITQIPLNETGIQQAHTLAQYFNTQAIPLTAIYSSDLIRASETARIVADAFNLTVHEDERLRELHLGVFQGLTFAEITAQYPEEVEKMNGHYMSYAAPEGEPRQLMQDRAYAAFTDIVRNAPGQEIAIFTHGGTIRVLLIRLFDESAVVHKSSIQNTSISVIETDGVTHRLLNTAATAHLSETVTPKPIRDDV